MANEDVSNDQLTAIKLSLAKLAKKQERLKRYENYYLGHHRFNFSSEKFTTQFGDRLKSFRDNLCKTAVRAPSDRMEILGFSGEKDSDLYKASWEIWKRSKMPRISRRIHRDAFKTGDAFLLVWAGEDGAARMVRQEPKQCAVFYDPETETVTRGVKTWQGEDKYIYLTLYYPDRIERYRSRNKQSEGNALEQPKAFIRRPMENKEDWSIENPFGVCPMFHFGLETSILDDVIPLNDALNKELSDLLVASESNSLRQRWTSGISYEIDQETGKKIIPFDRAGQWFTTQEVGGKFGDFADATLKDWLEVCDNFRNEIANVAGIPQYYFRLGTGDFPSGEALTKAESRFSSLIKDAQLDLGETWSNATALAMNIDGIKVDASALETQWSPAAPMTDNEKVDLAIKKKTVGVSDEQNLSEIGYGDADIKRMQNENKAKAAASAETFKGVFDAGGSIAS
jgi:hypothetical protein